MDQLHQLELEILYLLGILVASLVIWALKRLAAIFGVQLNANKQALLESIVNKGMTWAVTRTDDTIREKGWDHIDSKNAVINWAIPFIHGRFDDSLKKIGLNLNNDADRLRLEDMMERMWPDIVSRLSASPVTPPAPVTPAVVVSTPAP